MAKAEVPVFLTKLLFENERMFPDMVGLKRGGHFVKRYISVLLAVVLLLSCALVVSPKVHASTKAGETRAIAIVFDNSGSMYESGNQAWCRATYAMEVFASMLNAGDLLQIYPMCPITVGNQTYTMEAPLQITDAAQAATIRDIFTADAGGTPIESIDCAATGLQSVRADKKYMIVLTDGGTFSKNGVGFTKERTRKELDNRVSKYAGPAMTVMYLGIGSAACMPNSAESEYFSKKHAVNTADVLSTLTVMCNQIFGRDTLPKSRISGKSIEFDISMIKLIVFVQGENIANLKITGGSVGRQIGTQQTKYSTKGAGDLKSVPDTSLQGMIVTYEGCAAGKYNIEYTGTATSIEVYYEPDADLDFVFTDAAGNTVDPQALYEGDYKVSFGMKDAKTGKLISSDLLGNPKYQGSYFIDGKEHTITHEGFSGSVDVPLKMGEKFQANLTVTYLSGYTISKDSSDFGWPEGGIQVAPRPAGDFRLEITGGDDAYSLQDLEKGSTYIAKVYYQGTQLTGSELEKVELKWNPDASNVEIQKEFADDHWKLSLHYKDPAAPQNTVCGECTVNISASYCAQASDEAYTQTPLTYNIVDDFSPLQIELYAPETYIVIGELEKSKAFVVNLKLNGSPLTAEDFANVKLQVDCGGIEHTVTANQQDSSYLVKLLPTDGIGEGNYQIKVKAQYTDHIGRETTTDESVSITLSKIPLWLRWAIGILLLLILFLIIWVILHIKVLPTKAHTGKKLSNLNFDGEDVTKSTSFLAEIKKDGARMQTQYGGRKFGLQMSVTPGQDSYLYKQHKARSAEVKPISVRSFGPVTIQEALIGTAKYTFDDESRKLVPAIPNQKPFLLKNGTTVRYSGTIKDAGIDKDFEVLSKISFNKK